MKNISKKLCASLLCMVMLCASMLFGATSIAADEPITVRINGSDITFDQPPIIEDGRTLVPLRIIFESLDAQVDWDPATQTVIGRKGDITISLQIGSNILVRNGVEITLDVPARIVNDRTLVPVRAIAEKLQYRGGLERGDEMCYNRRHSGVWQRRASGRAV